MTRRQAQVGTPGVLNPTDQFGIDAADDPAGHAQHQRAGRHLHAFRDDSPRADDAAPAHPSPFEDDGAHPDQGILLDLTAVQDGPVSDADPGPDQAGHALIDVHHAVVLDVALGPKHDRRQVTAQDRVVPDAGFGLQRHVADQLRSPRDKGGGVDS